MGQSFYLIFICYVYINCLCLKIRNMIVYTIFNLDKEIFHVSETLNIIFTHNFCNND